MKIFSGKVLIFFLFLLKNRLWIHVRTVSLNYVYFRISSSTLSKFIDYIEVYHLYRSSTTISNLVIRLPVHDQYDTYSRSTLYVSLFAKTKPKNISTFLTTNQIFLLRKHRAVSYFYVEIVYNIFNLILRRFIYCSKFLRI